MASTSQITNPLGAQVLADGEVPRTFTAIAREVISGGFLVQTSGASGDVGSQVSSFGDGDLLVMGAQNVKLCNGIALNNAGSNELVTVAMRGDYLMRADANVSGGALVQHNGSGGVVNLQGAGSTATTALDNTPIGRAKLNAASGAYTIVSLNI